MIPIRCSRLAKWVLANFEQLLPKFHKVMPRDYKLVLEANKAAKRAAEERAAEEERLKTADAFAELQKLAKDAVASGTPPAVEVRCIGYGFV